MKKKTILGKNLPYEVWLKEFLNDVNNKIFPHNSFSNDDYKEKYISEIQGKSDKEAEKNHRIELIDNKELSKLLNRYFGRYWYSKLNVIFWDYKYGTTPRLIKLV